MEEGRNMLDREHVLIREQKQEETTYERDFVQERLLKQMLKVYILPETGVKLVDSFAAEALGLTNNENIFIYNKKYYIISEKIIEEIKKNDIDIEYITLAPINKDKIRVLNLVDGFYIDSSIASNLKSIDAKKIDFQENKYGPLTDEELEFVKNNYNIEIKYNSFNDNNIEQIKKI